MIDRELHKARALLIEGNALLRSVGVAQLKDVGVGHVVQCQRVRDARLLLEREHFDIVLCSREFEGADISGQDLLDELRREQLLPQSTVFLMTTAEPTYHQVVEAAESALDGLIVRPYNAATLAERLLEARQRKLALADVLRALDAGELEVAFARALKRFQEQQPYWPAAGRIAGELLLRLRRSADACKIFESLVRVKPTAWVRLGLARAQLGAGELVQARDTIQAVLADEPSSADAHEWLGRVQLAQGDLTAALASWCHAAEITPGCLVRLQQAGRLAHVLGDDASALVHLERAQSLGAASKLFDPYTWLALAWMRFDAGQAEALRQLSDAVTRAAERQPVPARLQRIEQAIQALALGEVAADQRDALASDAMAESFDIEAAQITLGTLARLPALDPPPGRLDLVDRIARRHCVSRTCTETLAAVVRPDPAIVERVRACHAQVSEHTDRAVNRSMRGDRAGAATELLRLGTHTLNTRLLEAAAVIARRQGADGQALDEVRIQAEELLARLPEPTDGLGGRRLHRGAAAR